MHVDGGASTQLFLYPLGVDWGEVLERLEVPEKPTVYVIRNKRLTPTRSPLESVGLPAVTMRTLDSLFRTQGFGDLYRVYLAALRDGTRFRMASVPEDDDLQPQELFDPVYMRALFDRGEAMARGGYPWKTTPPDFDAR